MTLAPHLVHILLPTAYALTAILTMGLAGYIFASYRTNPTARALGVISVFLLLWAVGMGGRLWSSTMDGTLVWNAVAYVGIAGTAISWVVFAQLYTGRDRYVTRPVIGLLSIPALLMVGLVATSGYHSLYYADMRLATRWDYVVLYTDETWLFYAATGWHYLLFLAGTVLILQFAANMHRRYRLHSAMLAVGAVGPLVLNALYVFDILGTGFDPTPFAFGVSVLLVAWAVLEDDFIDVMPIARARVLDVIHEGILVLDRQTRIIDYNAAAAALLSVPPTGSIIGHRAGDHLPEAVMATGILAPEFDPTSPVEVLLDTGDWYLVRRRTVALGGRQIAIILAFINVTERKRQEIQLEARTQRLEDFASVVSHDLRNPLNVVGSRLHLLAEEFESAHIEPMLDAIARMDRIIDDVLFLAREGRDIGELSPVSLSSVVDSAWASVDTPAATLDVDLDPGPTVLADDDRLQQAFENLFRNAIEHGGAEAIVRVGLLDDGSGVYVEDDGPGIPEQIRDRVFEGGFSTTDHGTGIGLRLVAEIVTAHGWDVAATEARGGGARIELSGVTFVTE